MRISDLSSDVCSSDRNLSVCPRCDHHDRIGAKQRFAQLFDGGLHEILFAPAAPEDPLKFRDTKKYVDRIKAARAQTGDRDAYQNGFGRIDGRPVVVVETDFALLGGSVGFPVGAAAVAAVEDRTSLVVGKRVSERGEI